MHKGLNNTGFASPAEQNSMQKYVCFCLTKGAKTEPAMRLVVPAFPGRNGKSPLHGVLRAFVSAQDGGGHVA